LGSPVGESAFSLVAVTVTGRRNAVFANRNTTASVVVRIANSVAAQGRKTPQIWGGADATPMAQSLLGEK